MPLEKNQGCRPQSLCQWKLSSNIRAWEETHLCGSLQRTLGVTNKRALCQATPQILTRAFSKRRVRFFFGCLQVWSALPDPVALMHCRSTWVAVRLASQVTSPSVHRRQHLVPHGWNAQRAPERVSRAFCFTEPLRPLKIVFLPTAQYTAEPLVFLEGDQLLRHLPHLGQRAQGPQ